MIGRAMCPCGAPCFPGQGACNGCLALRRGYAKTQADVDEFLAALRLAPPAATGSRSGTGAAKAAPSVETRAMRARSGAGGSP